MSSPLTDHDLLNRCTAIRTGLAGLSVNVEVVLKFAAAVEPVQAGAEAVDAMLQYRLDGLVQSIGFSDRQGI